MAVAYPAGSGTCCCCFNDNNNNNEPLSIGHRARPCYCFYAVPQRRCGVAPKSITFPQRATYPTPTTPLWPYHVSCRIKAVLIGKEKERQRAGTNILIEVYNN